MKRIKLTKRKAILLLMLCVIFTASSCGSGNSGSSTSSSTEASEESENEILDLMGNWEEEDAWNSESWQGGYIKDNKIEIFWITDSGESYALYWSGTYEPPTSSDDSYTWASINNKELTDYALMASGDDEKEFTYSNGEITYKVSFMGETTTVHLVPTDTAYTELEVEADSDDYAEGVGAATSTADADEVLSQVDLQYEQTTQGTLCVFITNNSSEIIDELDIQALYKDESGTTISVESDGHDMILPGYTVVSRIDAPESFDSVEFEAEIGLGEHPTYENHSEEVTIEAHDGADGIIVEITNNSDVEIEEIEYIVVYYSGDQITSVSYDQDVYDVAPGKTVTEEVTPWEVEYDRYEIYLNQAHTFGL